MDRLAKQTMGAREWALLIILSVLWGGTFLFVEVALEEVRPLTLVLGRVGLAAFALIVLVHATGGRLPRDLRLWGAFLIMGALNNVIPFGLISWGQMEISGSLAAILIATTPLFSVVLAHVLTTNEKTTPARIGGVMIGFAGVVVMVGPGALTGLGLHVLAQLAVLGAALSYAIAGIFGRRFAKLSPLTTAAAQLSASTLLMLPMVLIFEPPAASALPGAASWTAIVALALLSTALAYVIYFRILRTAGATNLLLVTFLIPISAILLTTTLLGERIGLAELAGMALIGMGLAAIDGRLLGALGRPSSLVATHRRPISVRANGSDEG